MGHGSAFEMSRIISDGELLLGALIQGGARRLALFWAVVAHANLKFYDFLTRELKAARLPAEHRYAIHTHVG